MACSLQGLIRFQSTWREIAEGIGFVSKRVRSYDPDYAPKVRERTLFSSLAELRTAGERSQILGSTKVLFRLTFMGHESIASRTAEGFYKTLISGAYYLCDYFVHIGENVLLDQVKVNSWDAHA